MATYKVIQDIEAEDKLVGPLTLRQFIYAGICVICLYLTFIVVTKGLGLAAIIFLPPAALFGFLAFPWGGEQPTEVWALAKIQFLIKPRKRIWNQSGIKEMVTVTAPKKVETVFTNGLSQTEVRSRLKALADTIDSRGWVIKNVTGPAFTTAGMPVSQSSDRLLGVSVTNAPTGFTERASEDILDMQHNPVAQQFDTMITASEKAHRQEIIERLNAPEPPTPPITAPAAPVLSPPPTAPTATTPANDYWFLNQPTQSGASVQQDAVTFNTQVVAPGTPTATLPVTAAAPTAAEEAFIKQHQLEQPLISPNMHGHLHVVQPLSAQQSAVPLTQTPPPAAMTPSGSTPTGSIYDNMTTTPFRPPTDASSAPIPAAPAPPATPPPSVAATPVTPAPDAAILDLARNDDLNVATIAREAQKRKESPDEVVISLH